MTRSRAIHGLFFPSGPLLRSRLLGPGGAAAGVLLVDTGASMSAVDRDIARELKLASPGAVTWRAINQATDEITPLRAAHLVIADDPREWDVHLIEIPNLQDRIAGYRLVAVLGLDFLDRCKLAIDGPARTFTLELPR